MELDREYGRVLFSDAALRNAATVFDETFGKLKGLAAPEGTEDFSNVQGIQQILFQDIKETFGEVVAMLRREFGGRVSTRQCPTAAARRRVPGSKATGPLTSTYWSITDRGDGYDDDESLSPWRDAP